MAYISFQEHTKMFNLDAIRNKNDKDDDKNWPYRMLIIGRPDQEKLKHYLISYKNKIATILLARFICMLKI